MEDGNARSSPYQYAFLKIGLAATALTFTSGLPHLWRNSSASGKEAARAVVIFYALSMQARTRALSAAVNVFMQQPPILTSACSVALAALHVWPSRQASALASGAARFLMAFNLPRHLSAAGEDLRNADFCALFSLAIAILLPGRRSSLSGLIILIMLTGGEVLEEYAIKRAGGDMASILAKMKMSKTVRRLQRRATEEQEQPGVEIVPIEDVMPNDVVVLPEGETVPVDGVAVFNAHRASVAANGPPVPAAVDSSSATGEFLKTVCRPGTAVFSGSIVLPGTPLHLRCSKPAKSSAMALLTDELTFALAQRRPSKLETKSATTAAALFTPCALLLAVASFVCRWRKPGLAAWETALGVLMGASPCPLVIGVPVAFLSGTSAAARRGITLKTGFALEQLANVSVAVLDKTGTLTVGKLVLRELIRHDDSSRGRDASLPTESPKPALFLTEIEMLEIVRAVERASGSAHPVARALLADDGADANSSENSSGGSSSRSPSRRIQWFCDDALATQGQGVKGTVTSAGSADTASRFEVAVGTAAFVQSAIEGTSSSSNVNALEAASSEEGAMQQPSVTVHFAIIDCRGTASPCSGELVFADKIRPESAALVKALKQFGIRIIIMSGDSGPGLAHVAKTLGISEVHSCLPHEKAAAVHDLLGGKVASATNPDAGNAARARSSMGSSNTRGKVLMVGDGINDAAALATADVGVCIGLNELSSAADVVISGREPLAKLGKLIALARRTVQVAELGITVGMSVSTLQMLLGAAGVIPPFANAAMQELVDLGAIGNSLRILLE